MYVRKLKSGHWQATIRHPSGRRLTKTDPLKRVVVEWAGREEDRMRRGEWVDPSGGRVTLDDWWAQWWSTRLVETATTNRNESQWRKHVQPAFGPWPLSAITSWEVEGWVARMVAANVGPETVAASLRLLRQVLAAAVRHRLLSSNPTELAHAPTPPKHVDRFLSHDEAAQLLECFTGQDRLMVMLLLNTGLRWSEAAGLRVMRVDLMRRRLSVVEVRRRDGSEKQRPKSEASQRQVPLTDALTAELSRHLATRPRDGLVLAQTNGKALSYTNWRARVWKRAILRAGLPHPQPTPHDLRHTYGSWLAEAGVPITEIAALMGHSTLRATERYVHATAARFERAIDALDAGDAPLTHATRFQRPPS